MPPDRVPVGPLRVPCPSQKGTYYPLTQPTATTSSPPRAGFLRQGRYNRAMPQPDHTHLSTEPTRPPLRPSPEVLWSLASQIERSRDNLRRIAADATEDEARAITPEGKRTARGLAELCLTLLNIESIASLSPPPVLPAPAPPRLRWRDRWALIKRAWYGA